MRKTNIWARAFTFGTLASICAAGAVLSGPGAESSLNLAKSGAACPTPGNVPGLAGTFARLDAATKAMIERRLALAESHSVPHFSACFQPGTPNEVMEAFRATEARLNPLGDRFQIAPRWESTAYTPDGSPLGKPLTVSYSIVPDGTDVQGFNGEADSDSDLRAYLDGIYGSEAVWLPIIQSVFNRWSQVSGINYVYEPSDDGAALRSPGGNQPSPFFGEPGVRGDVRISGHFISGPSGVLAYNFYPDWNDALGGDMVIDTGDNFFFDVSNSSVGLRNVLSHEHGHGMGQAHVCPIETTKLMEPFVTAVFDGPRQDDIRHAQYSYGDINEPNDFAGEATDLGTLDCSTITVGNMLVPVGPVAGAITENPVASTVSLSDINDDDFYAVTVNRATSLSVTAVPIGSSYDDSAQACSGQNGSCCSGNLTDSLTTVDLAINVLGTNGVTLLASAAGAAVGKTETVMNVAFPAAGTYYVQIKPAAASSTSQFYRLNITSKPTVLVAGLTGTSDVAVAAGALVPVGLTINNGTETFNLAASRFYYAFGAGAPISYLSAPIYNHGGGAYVAALADVPCGNVVQFFAELRTNTGGIVRLPCSGNYVAKTGTVFNTYTTDFTSGAGWVVGPNTASTGLWENVVPIGSAAQPGADHTAPGGSCFVTGQGAIGNSAGAFDIDGGSTLLTSPTINLAGMQGAEISYWRWYSTGAGAAPYSDTFLIEASVNGGGTWVTAETVGPGNVSDVNVNPGWRFKTFTLASIGLTPTANVKVRFNARDTGTGSIVEAALDDFAVRGFTCQPVVWCNGDLNLDGVVDDTDFVVFAAAYNLLDCADLTMPAGCPSDINGDKVVDDSDFVAFAAAYNNLLCP